MKHLTRRQQIVVRIYAAFLGILGIFHDAIRVMTPIVAVRKNATAQLSYLTHKWCQTSRLPMGRKDTNRKNMIADGLAVWGRRSNFK